MTTIITNQFSDMKSVILGTFHQVVLHARYHLKERVENLMLTSLSVEGKIYVENQNRHIDIIRAVNRRPYKPYIRYRHTGTVCRTGGHL